MDGGIRGHSAEFDGLAEKHKAFIKKRLTVDPVHHQRRASGA